MTTWLRRLCALAAGVAMVGCSGLRQSDMPVVASLQPRAAIDVSSVANAYAFLDLMMDKYATGSTIRLVQSFDGGGVGNFTDAVTYDDALTIDALLARGSADDLARAQVIGDAFLYAQAHDPARDGRLRAAYAPKPFLRPADVRVTDPTSDVGNMAWVGQSLVQLYFKTHKPTYLSGASEIATWILKHAYDKRGAGGYTGGYTASGMKIRWKSTEHNVDVYAFFSMLAKVTGPYAWLKHAAYAAAFVKAMWSPKRHRFFAGTGSDGVTPNRTFEPEDVNSWTYLAFADPAWASALDWNIEHLSVTAGGFSGVSFCSGDRSGVWFEGTAHLADALELRDDAGDATKARALLADVAYAQSYGPNGDGLGIIAASKNGLSDCDGDRYYASLHVGATAWYVMSASRVNPLQPLP